MTRSILNNKARCYLCGSSRYLERHHIFGGANRNLSEEYGLWVYLCFQCHRGKNGVHNNYDVMRGLREQGEEAWIDKGFGNQDDFLRKFGRNYL